MMVKRIGELEHILADLIQVNKNMEERLDKHEARLYTLEQLDIPQQVSIARMWESDSYKSHEDHMQLFEALEKSINRDHSKDLTQDLAEAREKKKKRRESPKTPPGSPSHQPPPSPPPAVFHPDVIHLQYQIEECHKLLTNSVDDPILRHNVSKLLLLGGPPSQVTIQSDFFFNKDLEYLRYDSKGRRPALSISKMKAAYYPDAGLEQMVPDQFWIEEECKYDSAAMYGISHWWFQRQRFYIDRHTSEEAFEDTKDLPQPRELCWRTRQRGRLQTDQDISALSASL
nr:hypothetical protein [Tanacetum cinerariifolium]